VEDVAHILARELPFNESAFVVDIEIPCPGLCREGGQIRDAALAQALAGEQADFQFRLIERTAMLRGVVNREAVPRWYSLLGAQGIGERFAAVDIEIVDH
jgi:hypothetical protein